MHQLMTELATPSLIIEQATGVIFTAIAQNRTTFLLFACLWLFLAIPVWRQARSMAQGALLRRRIWHVLLSALAYALLLITVRLLAVSQYAPGVRTTIEFKLWLFQVCVLLAIMVQAAFAALLTLRRPAATIGEACLCALFAGVPMSAVFLTINLAFGGGIDLPFAWTVMASIANQGAVVAFCSSVLGSGLRYALAGFRPLPVAAFDRWPPSLRWNRVHVG
jgi:hypothetical protein